MALYKSAIERHVERQDLPKRSLIADWSLTDLHDRQDRRRLTRLHKDPWRSGQIANWSLVDRMDRDRTANWSPISPVERNWNSTITIVALSNPFTKASMKASHVIKVPFYKTHCDYIPWFFVQYPRLYHLLCLLITNDFVFLWRECCDQFFHAQLVAYNYSN